MYGWSGTVISVYYMKSIVHTSATTYWMLSRFENTLSWKVKGEKGCKLKVLCFKLRYDIFCNFIFKNERRNGIICVMKHSYVRWILNRNFEIEKVYIFNCFLIGK